MKIDDPLIINTPELSHVAGFFPNQANCTLDLTTAGNPPGPFFSSPPGAPVAPGPNLCIRGRL